MEVRLKEKIPGVFWPVHQAIRRGEVREVVAKGGRGSGKSSYLSMELVWQLLRHPDCHAVVLRKVGGTLRNSVYNQIVWAIGELGCAGYFRCTVSPMECTYLPTGQKILFFGTDDPGKLKSLKLPFGAVGICWFEELDQFDGPEEVRNVEQTVLRGGSWTLTLKSFNPPAMARSWANRYALETRPGKLVHHSTYRDLPRATLPACAELVPQLVLPGVQGVGLAVLKTPLMNCVDGSTDAVSIYAPAAGLLHALARCEEQLNAEFANGASRVFASEDLLRPDAQGRRALQDDLFVGLSDDPANVGVTVYSPALREGSYLARKQDLLRGCESLLGLRRGILSEVETPAEPRTATEIAATSVDYDLTIRDLQSAWTDAVQQAMALCGALGAVYGLDGLPQTAAPAIDWGDGVLYDRARIWAEQRELVDAGLLRPELALAWYFDLPHETEAELAEIRRRFMGNAGRAQ